MPNPAMTSISRGERFSRIFKSLTTVSLLLLLLFAATACKKKDASSSESSDSPSSKPTLVATTTMLKDMAETLGGDDVKVKGIMTPGGDPHLYKPTPSDAAMISSANAVLTSGFHLEGWIDRLMKNAGGVPKVYIVATEGQQPRKIEGQPNAVDPHFWFDLKRWDQAAKHVGEEMQTIPGLDEAAKKRIAERTAAYVKNIEKTDAWANKILATIPEQQRILVTSHDAFGYFGLAYNVAVEGVQGLSTEQEASQRDVANVIDLVNERKIPVVFFETSTNPNLIKQVNRETEAQLAGPLYSDSIGVPNGPADTFLKTFQENVRMIVQGLGGKYEPLSN